MNDEKKSSNADIFSIDRYSDKNIGKIELKCREDLDLVIIVVYDYLKKQIRHFDNGFLNFGASMPVSNLEYLDAKLQEVSRKNLPDMDDNFAEYIKSLEGDKIFNFEYLSFQLSSIIRFYDGNNMYDSDNDEDDHDLDYNMDDSIDYPKVQILKQIYKKEIPHVDFLNGVLSLVLPKKTQATKFDYCIKNMYISVCFEQIYTLLIEVINYRDCKHDSNV